MPHTARSQPVDDFAKGISLSNDSALALWPVRRSHKGLAQPTNGGPPILLVRRELCGVGVV